MLARNPYAYFSPEEYLEIENISPIKHEYIQGQIYAMAGVSQAHILITGNLSLLLKNHLRGTGCLTYSTDMKVRIEARSIFYYPDIIVTCDERDKIYREDFVRHPNLIIEVLSGKTEAFDRGDKFADYKLINSLTEYVLVSQNQAIVERFYRESIDRWIPHIYRADDEIYLASIDFRCAIDRLYEDVDSLL
jgi:Uma2 family endonuclease